jgi:hypothetical protein
MEFLNVQILLGKKLRGVGTSLVLDTAVKAVQMYPRLMRLGQFVEGL